MKDSQIAKAIKFLSENPNLEESATNLKAILKLPCQESTLGRKLRLKATQGLIRRTYKQIASGQNIAQYSWRIPVLIQGLLFVEFKKWNHSL